MPVASGRQPLSELEALARGISRPDWFGPFAPHPTVHLVGLRRSFVNEHVFIGRMSARTVPEAGRHQREPEALGEDIERGTTGQPGPHHGGVVIFVEYADAGLDYRSVD